MTPLKDANTFRECLRPIWISDKEPLAIAPLPPTNTPYGRP